MNTIWDQLGAAELPRRRGELTRESVTRHELERHRVRTSHGFYRPDLDRTTAQRILDAAALVPPGGVISGWAAAWLHGATMLDGYDEFDRSPLPVTVVLPPGQRRRSIDGVSYQQAKEKLDAVEVAGVAITPVLPTAEQLARRARDLNRAVATLDSMLAAHVVSPYALTSTLSSLVGGRGAVQARTAGDLARPDVRSPWESHTRLCCELEAGYPYLLVNQPVYSPSGQLLGIPDLLDEEAGVAIEYDGAQWLDGRGHREPAQHREDNVREERFERTGLVVVRVDRADLVHHRAELRRRLRSARAQGLHRDRSRDRWTLDPTRREGGTR